MPTSTNPSAKTPIKSFPNSENTDPNLPNSSTPSKPIKTPSIKSFSKPKKPQNQRKFIVTKKKKKNNPAESDPQKCREKAYEALRASHEEFFKKDCDSIEEKEKMKSLVIDEAMGSLPEPGSGRVKHMVKAFESLLSISEGKEGTKDSMRKITDWGSAMKEEGSCSVLSSGEFERDSRLCSSLESLGQRLSLGSRTSNGSRRSRRNSMDSLRSSWNKKLKVTSQRPFKLRTEHRGRQKEENFLKKVKEMLIEDEKKRIPVAQGLPWTTDEPECLVKPPVKECTEPIDLVLHSDVRAVERTEFDQYVAERLSFIEQIKLEREQQQKLEEEEEIKRLRKELVPKAQPMPYFDRPFIPKKSTRPRTVPKEPRLHARQMKSSCVSLLGR